jgi:hypothetical protein
VVEVGLWLVLLEVRHVVEDRLVVAGLHPFENFEIGSICLWSEDVFRVACLMLAKFAQWPECV